MPLKQARSTAPLACCARRPRPGLIPRMGAGMARSTAAGRNTGSALGASGCVRTRRARAAMRKAPLSSLPPCGCSSPEETAAISTTRGRMATARHLQAWQRWCRKGRAGDEATQACRSAGVLRHGRGHAWLPRSFQCPSLQVRLPSRQHDIVQHRGRGAKSGVESCQREAAPLPRVSARRRRPGCDDRRGTGASKALDRALNLAITRQLR
mmetsp:Transcript_16041/g.49050  ORF Transcript_16041/g.49050 Transcript_16041/m.49050 type:complete len:210 (-) Transcript_16041:45-674(-)